MNEFTYLTDAQLQQLIDAAEAELQPAPPDLAAAVLAALEKPGEDILPSGQTQGEKLTPLGQVKPPEKAQREFIRYAIQVAFTAAAAAAIVIGLSLRPEPIPRREDVLRRNESGFSSRLDASYVISDYFNK